MTRIFVDPEKLGLELVTLTDEDHRYLTRVLRLEVGDLVTLFDGLSSEGQARITRIGPRAVELHIEHVTKVGTPDRPALTLIQALAKGEKLDLVVQKATELGVTRIMPVTSARSIPQLEAMRAIGRRTRWQKIAREAARQCGRTDVPVIEVVTPLPTALHAVSKDALRLFIWEGARGIGLGPVLPTTKPSEVVLTIGPEGGFSSAEAETAKAAGFLACGLGPRILRTETAALAAIAIIQFALGDLGDPSG